MKQNFIITLVTIPFALLSANDNYSLLDKLPNVIFVYADDLGKGLL